MEPINPDEVRRLRERLSASSRRLAREAKGRRLFEKISKTIELRPLLDILGAEILALGDFDGYLFNLVDEEQVNLVCEAIHLPEHCKSVEPTYLGFRFPFHLLDANVEAFKKGRSVYVNDQQVDKYPGTTRNRFERWNMQQLLILPLLNGRQPFGTVMAFTSGRAMSAGAEGRLRNLLSPFSQQICNAFAFERLRRREQEVMEASDQTKALLRFLERLNGLTAVAAMHELACEEMLQRYPFDLVGILMPEEQRLEVRKLALKPPYQELHPELTAHFQSIGGYLLDQSDGASSMVYMQNTHLYFPDVQEIMHLPMSRRDRQGLEKMRTPRSFFLLPIRARGKAMGVMWLVSLGEPADVSENLKEQIVMVAGFLGTAMANAEVHATLEQQRERLRLLAHRDGLTGLHNFGAFRDELGRRVSEYQREGGELSLVLVDIDRFKLFNETFGFLAGNLVLQGVAQRLRDACRQMDLPCRHAEAAFAVILPKCGSAGAEVFGERVRKAIAALPFQLEQDVQITVSVGCATYQTGESADDFLNRAQAAVREAKLGGRNRVACAP